MPNGYAKNVSNYGGITHITKTVITQQFANPFFATLSQQALDSPFHNVSLLTYPSHKPLRLTLFAQTEIPGLSAGFRK